MWNGPLTPRSLPLLLRRIHAQQKDGGLVCEVSRKRFAFWVERRNLIRVKTAQPQDGFMAFLQAHRLLDSSKTESIGVSGKTETTGEDVLFEKGLLCPEILHQQYVRYTERLLLWIDRQEGRFQFFPMEKEKMPTGRCAVPLTQALLRLLREDLPEDWLTERFHLLREIPLVLSPEWKQLCSDYKLSPREESILSQFTQPLILSRWIPQQPFSRKEALHGVYLLYSLQLILAENRIPETGQPDQATADPSLRHNPDRQAGTVEEQLQNLLEKWSHADHFQVLGVSKSAVPEEIKNAYYSLVKKYHPDLFADSTHSTQSRLLVAEVFERIRRAYETLKKEELKNRYETETRERGRNSESGLSMGDSVNEGASPSDQEAEIHFQKGLRLIEGKDLDAGLASLRYAVSLKDDVAGYHSALAKILRTFPRFRKEAEENFLQAIRLEPFQTDNYLQLSLLYKEAGLPRRAESQLRKALVHQPDNTLLREELRRLVTASRYPPEKESSSVFDKIVGAFTKKD